MLLKLKRNFLKLFIWAGKPHNLRQAWFLTKINSITVSRWAGACKKFISRCVWRTWSQIDIHQWTSWNQSKDWKELFGITEKRSLFNLALRSILVPKSQWTNEELTKGQIRVKSQDRRQSCQNRVYTVNELKWSCTRSSTLEQWFQAGTNIPTAGSYTSMISSSLAELFSYQPSTQPSNDRFK